MPKAKIVEKRIICVPYESMSNTYSARKWLWEYLRDNNLTASTIYHNDKDVVAEVVVGTEEKDF